MVDLHHHLLPGLDDGSPDLATSVAMARAAVADGITHIVCTPHASGRYAFDPDTIAAKVVELRATLAAENIPLTLGAGCDFHLSYDNILDAEANPTKYTINAHRYLLVELPDFGFQASLRETFFDFQRLGMVPILTHPERNPTLQRDTARLADWMRDGMLTQITAGSLTGKMGKEAERMAHKLLADRWVHFIGTDAHNLTTRAPAMRQACELVTKRYGADYARLLCVTNPLTVFQGRPLPTQEDLRNLHEEEDEASRSPWWKRLFAG